MCLLRDVYSEAFPPVRDGQVLGAGLCVEDGGGLKVDVDRGAPGRVHRRCQVAGTCRAHNSIGRAPSRGRGGHVKLWVVGGPR